VDIVINQGESITIKVVDDDNPIEGELTIVFCETYCSIAGYISGNDKQDNINHFVKR